jgi:hypothetical protein
MMSLVIRRSRSWAAMELMPPRIVETVHFGVAVQQDMQI